MGHQAIKNRDTWQVEAKWREIQDCSNILPVKLSRQQFREGTQANYWKTTEHMVLRSQRAIQFTEQRTGKEKAAQSKSFSRGLLLSIQLSTNTTGDWRKKNTRRLEADKGNCPFLLMNLFTLPCCSLGHFCNLKLTMCLYILAFHLLCDGCFECAESSINSSLCIS